MTAFKRSQARYVRKSYKTTNWPEYEAGLRQRGSLTVWISEDELKGWGPPKHGQRKPGGQQQHSNRAIETAVTVLWCAAGTGVRAGCALRLPWDGSAECTWAVAGLPTPEYTSFEIFLRLLIGFRDVVGRLLPLAN
jgi:hypothetical protein